MKSKLLVIFVFLLVNMPYRECVSLRTFFMEDLCFQTEKAILDLKYENSGLLMSAPRHYSNDFFKCELTLRAPRNSSIVLSIYRYDIPSGDTLVIEDSDRHKVGLLGWATFPDEKKSMISNGKLVITYTRNENSTRSPARGSAFQFTFTRVEEHPSGKCYDNQFRCKNQKCIMKTLLCDGHNHCGDNSDQIRCNPENPVTSNNSGNSFKIGNTALLVLGIISAILLTAIIVIFIIVIIRSGYKSKHQHSDENQSRGNINLESVATEGTPTTSTPQQATNNMQTSAAEQPRETFYNRIRRSFRRPNTENVTEVPTHQEAYQVPSMYPTLGHIPSAPPQLSGEENLNFNPEE